MNNIVDVRKEEEAKRFWSRNSLLDKLYDIVRRNSDMRSTTFGSSLSEIVFYFDFEKTNDRIFEFLKTFFSKNNVDIYSLMFININKTNNKEANKKIIEKELMILKPKKVLAIGCEEMFINPGDNIRIMNKNSMDIILRKKFDNENVEESVSILAAKEFIDSMNFAFSKTV